MSLMKDKHVILIVSDGVMSQVIKELTVQFILPLVNFFNALQYTSRLLHSQKSISLIHESERCRVDKQPAEGIEP